MQYHKLNAVPWLPYLPKARCPTMLGLLKPYRGTSLIRKRDPLGPYRRSMHGDLWWSNGGRRFLGARYPCKGPKGSSRRSLRRRRRQGEAWSRTYCRSCAGPHLQEDAKCSRTTCCVDAGVHHKEDNTPSDTVEYDPITKRQLFSRNSGLVCCNFGHFTPWT